MVAALLDFLICTNLHRLPFMASNPLPALHSFAPIVSLFYVTHPLYSCASNTDLYPLTPVSLLSRFLPLSYSFPYAPVSQFSLHPLLQFSSQLFLFPCLTVFPCSPVSQFSLFPLSGCVDPFFLIWTPSCISNAHLLLAYINPM